MKTEKSNIGKRGSYGFLNSVTKNSTVTFPLAPESAPLTRTSIMLISCLLLSFILTSCGMNPFTDQNSDKDSQSEIWLASGSIILARPVPEHSSESLQSPGMMAFSPSSTETDVTLIIDTAKSSLELRDGSKTLHSLSAINLQLQPGHYQVVHKQRNAPWHASDNYFTRRGMNVPPTGSRERFLRGAVGEYAVFIDSSIPLHSSRMWSEDVGGARLTESDMARIYYKLPLGARVVVK